jgi:hypothetical protein
VQPKSKSFQSFCERTDLLATFLRLNVSDLPAKIEVSTSMFHSYRSGKQPISDKAWRKLEAAEARAGIGQPLGADAESSGKVKDSGAAMGGKEAGKDYKTLFYKVAQESDLTWLLDRVDQFLEEAAGGDVEAAKLAQLLLPILRSRCEALEELRKS